jgi:hypothetical protein
LYSREGGEMLSNISSVGSVLPSRGGVACRIVRSACCDATAPSTGMVALCGAPVVEKLLRETYTRASAAKRGPSANADEVQSWMFTILRNVWLNGRRRIWPRESPLFEDADGVVSIGCGPQRFFRSGAYTAPSARQNWVHFHAAFGQKFGNVFVGRRNGVL